MVSFFNRHKVIALIDPSFVRGRSRSVGTPTETGGGTAKATSRASRSQRLSSLPGHLRHVDRFPFRLSNNDVGDAARRERTLAPVSLDSSQLAQLPESLRRTGKCVAE